MFPNLFSLYMFPGFLNILIYSYVNIYFITDDIFGIDEITLYEGEHSERVYSVAGEILDGVSIITLIWDIYSLWDLYLKIIVIINNETHINIIIYINIIII